MLHLEQGSLQTPQKALALSEGCSDPDIFPAKGAVAQEALDIPQAWESRSCSALRRLTVTPCETSNGAVKKRGPKQYPYNNLYLEKGGDPSQEPPEVKHYEI
uniref:Uncharacterized protein n=1 Tax=Sphaerodactylus townsendi TaxID=933632 RepID=A0ACB8F874_9SAUR